MRKTFDPIVEKGRILTGYFASKPGDTYGSFSIRCPYTTTWLNVIMADGSEWEIMGLALPQWEHVSVSNVQRCPTWEEMCFIKNLFWLPEECVVQFHPPKSEYVNLHERVLHLWRVVGVPFLMPPIKCV